MPATIVIPPHYWSGETQLEFILTDSAGRMYPAELADNSGFVGGRKIYTVGPSGLTFDIPTNDELPAAPGDGGNPSTWTIRIQQDRYRAFFCVSITSANPPTNWSELVGASTPVDPADIWQSRLWPVDGISNVGNYGRVAIDGSIEFVPPPSGTGDVSGPAGASDGNMAVFDGPTGKVIRDGGPPGGGGGIPEPTDDGIPKLRVTAASVSSWVDSGDSATRDVGTGAGDVARGDHLHPGVYDPAGSAQAVQDDLNVHRASGDHDARYDSAGTAAGAVAGHEFTYAHDRIPSAAQNDALDANPALSGANPVAGQTEIVDEAANLKSTGQPAGRIIETDGADGFVYIPTPSGGGASAFTDLTDTPPDYSGQQGKLVKVNATEDGLIYGDPSGTSVSWGDIVGTLANQTDLQGELDAKLGDAPSDGNHYGRLDGTWRITPISPIGSIPLQYVWSADTAPSSPASGGIKVNNADQTLATELYVHQNTSVGNDASSVWMSYQAGDYIGVWEDGSDREGIYYSVTGAPQNNIGWYTIPIAVVPGSIGGMEDGQSVRSFPMRDPRNRNPIGGAQFDVLRKASAADHATQWHMLVPADIGAEPAFVKNTAFNKNFGGLSDTVCQGNDARLSDARTPTSHAASHMGGSDPITPAGIGAAPDARAINTGTGLTGGGDLTQDRVIALGNTAVAPGSYTNTDLTVDSQGRITAAANGSSAGIPEAPSDGNGYRRKDAAWEADPIQADAPSDGTGYVRKDGVWAAETGGGVPPDAQLDGYTETEDLALTSVAGTLTVPLDGRPREVTLTENTTMAATPPGAGIAGSCDIVLVQTASSWTLAYDAGWLWPDGTPASMPTGNGERLYLSLIEIAGTVYARGQEMA